MKKSTLPLPLPESYWVKEGSFLAGEYPASRISFSSHTTLQDLLKAGIDTFIDLTEPHEFGSYENSLVDEATRLGMTATYHRFPIEDWGLPGKAQMTTISGCHRPGVGGRAQGVPALLGRDRADRHDRGLLSRPARADRGAGAGAVGGMVAGCPQAALLQPFPGNRTPAGLHPELA